MSTINNITNCLFNKYLQLFVDIDASVSVYIKNAKHLNGCVSVTSMSMCMNEGRTLQKTRYVF